MSQNKSNKKVIEYYLDSDQKEKAPTDDEGNLDLDFGTTLQGQSKKIRLYAKSLIEYPIELEPIYSNESEKDLKITKYPAILKVGEMGVVDIVFSPDPERLSPLEAHFDFRKVILSRI